MNKFIKIFATALFALFITACNKADPTTEFKTLMNFVETQQQAGAALQAEIQAKLASQDPAQMESAVNDIKARTEQIGKELDALKISTNEVKPFKDKFKSTVVLGNELLADALVLMQKPTPELEKVVQEKTQKLQQAAQDFQQLQAELQAKFAPAK